MPSTTLTGLKSLNMNLTMASESDLYRCELDGKIDGFEGVKRLLTFSCLLEPGHSDELDEVGISGNN